MKPSLRPLWICALAAAAAPMAMAAPVITTDNTVISAFQVGANVFDLEGLPGQAVSALNATLDGTPTAAGSQIYKIGGGHFHSGGASFKDLTGNPGAPSVVVELDPALRAGNVRSGGHALMTTHAGDVADPPNATLCADGSCFFEIEFTSPIARFGAWIGGGDVSVLIKDRVVLSDGTDDTVALDFFSVGAGQFFGFSSALANIDSITISVKGGGTFLIDDITIGGSSTGGGGGGTGTVPLPGTLAMAGLGLGLLVRRQPRRQGLAPGAA